MKKQNDYYKRFYREIQDWYFWVFKTSDMQSYDILKTFTQMFFLWLLKEKDVIDIDVFQGSKLIQLDEELPFLFDILHFDINKTEISDKYLSSLGEEIDLSDEYEVKKIKMVKVRGLIEVFKSYNFSFDNEENTINIKTLGKVFENLLAVYNPETQKNARKSTASFYTPREIVDYMVAESLVAHLKTKFEERGGNISEEVENNINELVNTDKQPFNGEDVQFIVSVISQIKILDPAVGSGAFTVGVLDKLVWLLEKIDGDNKLWKNIHKNSRSNEFVFSSMNNDNYSRKFYLMQYNIFGVDIQPLAIRIAKMNFYISLIKEQSIESIKKGIFPNLDKTFAIANTLISLDDKQEETQMSLFNIDGRTDREKLLEIRQKYLRADSVEEEKKYENEYLKLRDELLKKYE